MTLKVSNTRREVICVSNELRNFDRLGVRGVKDVLVAHWELLRKEVARRIPEVCAVAWQPRRRSVTTRILKI